MNASVIPLRPVAPDPLSALHAEREGLAKELARFGVVDQRQAAAGAKLAEVDQALAAIDRADREAVELWAATAEGEPPAPLLAERKALLARRLDAEAERQAAEVAVNAVAARRTGLIHKTNAVGAKIREVQVAEALDEAKRLHAEAQSFGVEIADRLQRIMGLNAALRELSLEASNRRQDEQARVFAAGLSVLDVLRPPEVLADPATVASFAADWRGKLQ